MNRLHISEIRIIPYRRYPATVNMAIDRYLLGMPGTYLRLYGWEHPTLSFGRLHRGLEDIDHNYCHNRGIHLVKRISGGKTVFHQHELTYAFISDTALFPDSVADTYCEISRVLAASFRHFGLQTGMSADKDESGDTSICFRETSAYELTVNSRKLVGSAQYRKRDRFFQHGSILLDIDWEAWKRIWKLPRTSTTLEDRVTCLSSELQRSVAAETLAAEIIRQFGIHFQSELRDWSFRADDVKAIDALSRKYVWREA